MKVDIAVVGSANLDLVVDVSKVPLVGETVLGGDLRHIPGGKGGNQAVAAARLGRSVAMIGRLGDDAAGSELRASLECDGIDTSNLFTTPGAPSGTALIAVQSDGDNAIVVSPGANARLSIADLDRARSSISAAAIVLLQLEVPLEVVVAAAEMAEGTVVLNPAPAPMGGLPDALLAATDVLVPNQTELATLSGFVGSVDPVIAVDLARSLSCRSVVVTLGADGALVVDSETVEHVAAPSVEPVDTTAAGDSFCGALADALFRDATLTEATRWAVQVGAATTLRAGAQPSLPTRSEVEQLLG